MEVSGWARKTFLWSGAISHGVRSLHENAILYVRLLQPGESERSHPVVYEAEHLGKTGSGLHQFRLSAVVPRPRERESSVA